MRWVFFIPMVAGTIINTVEDWHTSIYFESEWGFILTTFSIFCTLMANRGNGNSHLTQPQQVVSLCCSFHMCCCPWFQHCNFSNFLVCFNSNFYIQKISRFKLRSKKSCNTNKKRWVNNLVWFYKNRRIFGIWVDFCSFDSVAVFNHSSSLHKNGPFEKRLKVVLCFWYLVLFLQHLGYFMCS